VVLEGGYDLGAVTRSTGAVLAGLLGAPYCPEPPTAGGPGMRQVELSKHARRAGVEGR